MSATVFIDGKRFPADEKKNLLETCLEHGLDLPFFCWHPALGSIGACRQCAVKVDGRVVMACMTAVKEGARISIDDAEARTFRRSVIEWLMVNHPHDCPVCDEGGECHLQDMTLMTGHTRREYRFDKRTFRNQDLGPFLRHEMNRCIQCYRCVRFYGDYAGGKDLRAFAIHDHVYFGRFEDGPLTSPFSGNLVEVCPTGVFTDRTLFEHYTRKWDLMTAPSVCVHCGVGCNITPGARQDVVRRIRARYHHLVNGWFLCDRGRYGYEFVNHEYRIKQPLLPKGTEVEAEAIEGQLAVGLVAESLVPGNAVGIGSPRASLEANFLLRELVGKERFVAGMADAEHEAITFYLELCRIGGFELAALREVEQADAILILGEDPTATAPMLDLALRCAARNGPVRAALELGIPRWNDVAIRDATQDRTGPFFIASTHPTELDELGIAFRAAPQDIARLGFAVAHALDPAAPSVPDLEEAIAELAQAIALAFAAAVRPLVVTGTGAESLDVIRSAANVAWAARRRRGDPIDLFFVVPECNSVGVALLGGLSLGRARPVIEQAETVVVLENDLFRRAPRSELDPIFQRARSIIVIDHTATKTGAEARVVLPSTPFSEAAGTLVNHEGRAQPFFRVLSPSGDVRDAWRWIRDLMGAIGRPEAKELETIDDVRARIADEETWFAPRPLPRPGKLPRAFPRFSGRTALEADRSIHEPAPSIDPDSAFAFSMEGTPHDGALANEFWAPGWNSIQSLTRFMEEIGGPLKGDSLGVRVLHSDPNAEPPYFDHPPPPFEPKTNALLVVARSHVFGSEELSSLSAPIAARAPEPYLALHPADAARAGTSVELLLDGRRVRLPVRVLPGLPRGIGLLPLGLLGLYEALPAWKELLE